MDHYAVFGNPIVQSKSPRIHAIFAQQTRQAMQYDAILAPVDDFAGALSDFFSDPTAKGCNVTLPFKQEAFAWVDALSEQASVAGAVNTIIRQADGTFRGDNTDGYGLVLDLLSQGLELKGRSILLIGAGGAARGVVAPLLDEQPDAIVIANRTADKARALCHAFSSAKLEGCGFNELTRSFDIVVNCTSASLDGTLPDVPDCVFESAGVAYDMAYADVPTVFVEHAKQCGVANALDGLGMLVGQAAQSFYLWRGVRPDVQAALHSLRGQG